MSESNMNDDTPLKRRDVIAGEAAAYFVALKTPDPKARAEFADWLRISPEHVREFLAVAAVWGDLVEASSQPSADELIRLAAGDSNVVPLQEPGDHVSAGASAARPVPAPRGGPRTWWPGLAACAALAAILAGGYMFGVPVLLDPNLYRTAAGEQTSISLADGSIVTLNTRSKMRVEYSEQARVVRLSEGEALFEVARDPARPFRVTAGSAEIRAVGTEFNVRSKADDVTVTVVEGIVDVSATGQSSTQAAGETASARAVAPIRLTAGQQARVESRSGQVAMIEAPAAEHAIAWKDRRLVFEHLSLEQVIAEFNRYNEPPILIDDPELRELPISGIFRSNDRESFVQFLSRMNLAESEKRDDGSIVLRRVQKKW